MSVCSTCAQVDTNFSFFVLEEDDEDETNQDSSSHDLSEEEM